MHAKSPARTRVDILPLPKDFCDGAHFRGYIIGAHLGSGGFGRVYEVSKDTLEKSKFAMKVIHLDKSDPNFSRHESVVLKEVEVMTNLKNKNILNLVDHFSHQEDHLVYHFLISQLCDFNLREFLKNFGQPSQFRLITFMRQMVNGFMELSRHQVMHRDIKLDNIFWIKDIDTVVIGDFGLAKIGIEWTKTVAGSKDYLPPEIKQLLDAQKSIKQDSGDKLSSPPISDNTNCYDNKVDVYCLGVVFYELIGGVITSPSVTEATMSRPIKSKLKIGERFKFDPADPVDPNVKQLLEGMLECNSLNRLSWAEIVSHPLFKQQVKDPTYGGKHINTVDELLNTFVDDQSFLCHANENARFEQFSVEKKKYEIEIKTKSQSWTESPPMLRHRLNKLVTKYFELGKKFLTRRMFQTQERICDKAIIAPFLKTCCRASLACALYFSFVFGELEMEANNLLNECHNNEEVISFISWASKAKILCEEIKPTFDRAVLVELKDLDCQSLQNIVEEDCTSIVNTLLSRSAVKDKEKAFEHVIKELVGNMYFLVQFKASYFSMRAVCEVDWHHSLEEISYSPDHKIIEAFYYRITEKAQKIMSDF